MRTQSGKSSHLCAERRERDPGTLPVSEHEHLSGRTGACDHLQGESTQTTRQCERRTAHLPHPDGCRHPAAPRAESARGERPGAEYGNGTQMRAPVQQYLRGGILPRATEFLLRRESTESARTRRQRQNGQERGQLHLSGRRRQDHQEKSDEGRDRHGTADAQQRAARGDRESIHLPPPLLHTRHLRVFRRKMERLHPALRRPEETDSRRPLQDHRSDTRAYQ